MDVDDLMIYITCPLLFFARTMGWWQGPDMVGIVRRVTGLFLEGNSIQDSLIVAWEKFTGLRWAAGAVPALERALKPYLEGKIRRWDGLTYVSPLRSPGFLREAERHGYLEWRQQMERENPDLLPLFEESVLALLRWARHTGGCRYCLEHLEVPVGDLIVKGDLLVGKRSTGEVVEVLEYTAAFPESRYDLAVRLPVHLAIRREGDFTVVWNNLRTGQRVEVRASSLRDVGDVLVLAVVRAVHFGIRSRWVVPRSMALTGECLVCAARRRCEDLAGLVAGHLVAGSR